MKGLCLHPRSRGECAGCPPRLACECSGQGGKGFPQSQINSGDVPRETLVPSAPSRPEPPEGRCPLPSLVTRRPRLGVVRSDFTLVVFSISRCRLHFYISCFHPSGGAGFCCPRERPDAPAAPRPVGADSPGAWPGHQRFPLSVVCFFLPPPLPLIHRLLVFLEVCIHHRHQFIFFQFY